jgi:hypothetical protein
MYSLTGSLRSWEPKELLGSVPNKRIGTKQLFHANLDKEINAK